MMDNQNDLTSDAAGVDEVEPCLPPDETSHHVVDVFQEEALHECVAIPSYLAADTQLGVQAPVLSSVQENLDNHPPVPDGFGTLTADVRNYHVSVAASSR